MAGLQEVGLNKTIVVVQSADEKVQVVGVIQVNLHHSKTVLATLVLWLTKTLKVIAPIQGPWSMGNKLCKLRYTSYSLKHT